MMEFRDSLLEVIESLDEYNHQLPLTNNQINVNQNYTASSKNIDIVVDTINEKGAENQLESDTPSQHDDVSGLDMLDMDSPTNSESASAQKSDVSAQVDNYDIENMPIVLRRSFYLKHQIL